MNQKRLKIRGSRARLGTLALVLTCSAVVTQWTPAAHAQTLHPSRAQPVVLLHGLARSAQSMQVMAAELEAAGFDVCNIGYPSTDHPIDTLAREHVLPAIRACTDHRRGEHDQQLIVQAVTHSMGGIIARHLATQGLVEFSRVVMLAPPNQGSEVVDRLGGFPPFQWINGPAGEQLSTRADSVPNALPAPDFELGIIAGNRSINWVLSALIPGQDDGKVSLERAKLDGMRDYRVVAATHPLIMRDDEAQRLTIQFLTRGNFGGLSPSATGR